MSKKEKALVVLSGGQDSTTALFWACLLWGKHNVTALTFDYGQTHRIEIESARKVAQMADVSWGLLEVPGILASTSPLTNPNSELERYENAEQMDAIIGDRREKTFVPMRNALFLTLAANQAEAASITNIVVGVCQMDNANYDDCRAVFLDATTHYINTALGHDHRGTPAINVHAPLLMLSKCETVKLAHELPGCWEAMAYTHTSYDGKYPPTDMNHANVLRADGFAKAGLPDPLVLRAHAEGLMPLPGTCNYNIARSTRGL